MYRHLATEAIETEPTMQTSLVFSILLLTLSSEEKLDASCYSFSSLLVPMLSLVSYIFYNNLAIYYYRFFSNQSNR